MERVEILLRGLRDFRARYAMEPKNRTPLRITHDPGARGWIIVPTLPSIYPRIRSVVASIIETDPDLIHYRGNILIISPNPPAHVPWEQLLVSHDVLCACTTEAPCDCHMTDGRCPSLATDTPSWMIVD